MASPFNSLPNPFAENDGLLGGIDDGLRSEFQAGGFDLTRRGLSQAGFESVEDAAEALTNRRIAREISEFRQNNGRDPSRAEINTRLDQIAPEYQQRLSRLQAEAARRRQTQGTADRASEPGVLGTVGRLAGQAGTGLVTGVGRLATMTVRAGLGVRQALGLGDEAENEAFLRGVDELDQNITDFREGVQQEITLPGAQRLQQQLQQQAQDNPDASFGESVGRTLATVLSSPDRGAYLADLLAYGIGASAAGGLATGGLRAGANAAAQRLGTNVAVGTAARLNGVTGLAAGQALVGAGEVGEDVRQQYLELDRQGLLANSPDFQQFYDTIDAASETGVPYEEARDRYIRNRAATGRLLGGALTGVTTFLAPSTEAAMFGFGRALSTRSIGAFGDALPIAPGSVLARVTGGAAREGAFEAIEEVGQQAIPNFVGGLEQDEAALGQAAAAGLLLGGVSGGAVGGFRPNPNPKPEAFGPPDLTPEQEAAMAERRANTLPAPDLFAAPTADPAAPATPGAGLEAEVAARFARVQSDGLVMSADLARVQAAPDADPEVVAERIAEERTARRRFTAGTFSTSDAAGAAGLSADDAQRLRGLVQTGDAETYFAGAEGADRARLAQNALRYANSTAGDGDPITNIDLAVRASNDPNVLGPVGDPDTARGDALFGARVAQVLRRQNVIEAGFDAGPRAVFGRAGRTGAIADRDTHNGAYPENEVFETYFSDPDGRDFAIALDQAQIVYREQGEAEWRSIDEGDSAIRREALTKGFAAASDAQNPDTDLLTVLDDVQQNTQVPVLPFDQSRNDAEIAASQEAFVIAAAQAAPQLRDEQAAAQEAAVQYLRTPQAVEAWQQAVEGAPRNMVLPPEGLQAEAPAGAFIETVIQRASAELEALQSPYDAPTVNGRLARVRAGLNRSEDLRALSDDAVASGSAQMNAFVRELAATETASARAQLAQRVMTALTDGDPEAEVSGLSLAQSSDGFFAQSGPAGTLRSATPAADLMAVAHATLRRAVREQRLERVLERDLAVRDGEIYNDVDDAAIETAFRQTGQSEALLEFNPQATPLERERGAQAIVSALQTTPGVNPFPPIATPADPFATAATDAAALAQDAAALGDVDPTIAGETLLDIAERVQAFPDSHLNSGSLHGLREAANRLRRAHQFARSAPINARARFTNTMARLRHTATSFEAQTGQRVDTTNPSPEQVARIEGPGVARARLEAQMAANATRSADPEVRVRAAKLAQPLLPDAEIASALEAPVTVEQINALEAQERAARDAETDVTSGPVEGDNDTRFKLGGPVANPIDEATFRRRVEEQRTALRGERIAVRGYDTFQQYLQDLAQRYAGTTEEDVVRRYIATVPPFAGQFTQRENGAEVVLIREAIADEAALERVLSHEVVGHYRMADILSPAQYRSVRATIQAATRRVDPELYRMRQRVERDMLASLRKDKGFDAAEARRVLQTPSMVEAVADEVLGELAERLVDGAPLAPESTRVVSMIQSGLDAAGLPTRNAGTRWVGRLLQIARDTTTGQTNPMQATARQAQIRSALGQKAGREAFSVIDETWLQERYRKNLNSVAHLGRIERATRDLLPEVSDLWAEVRRSEDRANRTSAAVAAAMEPDLRAVAETAQQMFDNSGMNRTEFDQDFMAWLNARDYLDRVPAIVLNQMQSENSAFNEHRAALREQIIEESFDSPDGRTPTGDGYIAELRRFAEQNEVQDVLGALDPGSAAWRNITGFTYANITDITDGLVGQRMNDLVGKSTVGGRSLDDALDSLRDQFYAAQRASGTYGTRGTALARALGIRHYIPQEARAEDAGATDEALATFRASNPELAQAANSDLAAFDILKSRAPTAFDHDIDPFATRPRNNFLSPVRGSALPPTVHPLVMLQVKARTAANDVATQDLHRRVRDAVLETQTAESDGDGTTQFGRVAEIIRDFDLTTPEGQDSFREQIAQGNMVVAYDETGDATLMQINDAALLSAMTDRHITQARVERNAVVRTFGQSTRFLGRLHTSLDPMFVVFKQFVRDLPEAALVAGGGEQRFSPAAAGRVAAEGLQNVRRLMPFFLRGPEYQQERLAEWRGQPAGSWQRNFAEFVDAGGRQAFSQGIDDVVAGLAGGAVARQEFDGARTPFEFIGDAARATADTVGQGRITGRDTVSRSAVRRMEGFTNAFDNATRFALFNEVRRQKTSGDGRLRKSEATTQAVEVSNSLLPFNRRSELSRQLSPFFAFFNVAVASTDAALTRRIWRGGEMPTRTVRVDGGRTQVRLDVDRVARELNWPLASFVAMKGFVATALALQFVGADEEDSPEEGVDRARISTYMGGTVLPGTVAAGRDGEGLAGVIPEQLGVTGQLNAIGAGLALAMFSDYEWSDIALNLGVAATKNLTPVNFDTSADTGNAMADFTRMFTPTLANTLNEVIFDTNRFNNPVRRLRDGQSSTGVPQSTRFSPGVLAMTRALEGALARDVTDPQTGEVIGQEPGITIDPGVVKWMTDQAGAFGDLARTSLDTWARYSTGESVEAVPMLARTTGLFPGTPQYATRSGFYRYVQNIEDARNTFRALAKQDVEAGDAGTEGVPNFSPRARSKMGPRASAFIDTLPEGFWDAKRAVDRGSPAIGKIKQEVDNIRRGPNPDPERIADLLEEETMIYREALDLLRDAFDDGYDAQLVF